MESVSQSASSPDRHSNRWAEIIGTFIALLTLTLPLTVIGYYSSLPDAPRPAISSVKVSK